jgi:hypothetical protein
MVMMSRTLLRRGSTAVCGAHLGQQTGSKRLKSTSLDHAETDWERPEKQHR